MTPTSASCRSIMRENETSGAASETPMMRPVSSTGKKPFGTTTARRPVNATRGDGGEERRAPVAQHPRQRALVEACVVAEKPRSNARANAPGCSSSCGLRSQADIIAVSVSDKSAETPMAIASVTANSRKRRPMSPPMNRSGIKTATSETVSETMVKPICRAPFERRFERLFAGLDVARDVLDHDDGVVDDEAGRDGERHQRQVVQREAAQVHDAEGGDERQRHRDAGDDGGADAAQKDVDDEHDQQHGEERA